MASYLYSHTCAALFWPEHFAAASHPAFRRYSANDMTRYLQTQYVLAHTHTPRLCFLLLLLSVVVCGMGRNTQAFPGTCSATLFTRFYASVYISVNAAFCCCASASAELGGERERESVGGVFGVCVCVCVGVSSSTSSISRAASAPPC